MAMHPFAIFDMDGTLVDSMWCWNNVYLEFLRAHSAGEAAEELVAHTAHLTTYESAALFRDYLSLDRSAADIAFALDERMKELYQHNVQQKPGVRAYLERLRNEAVHMCVVSSTPEPLIRICLERLGLLPFFSFILSCDTIGKGKNEPDAYLAAAKRMGATPSETAVYEDSPTALLTAKKAGFYTVAVYDESSAAHWASLSQTADEAIVDWRSV
ncbi:MAG: HAD family phosphatase [Clostridia bacterium]|nr:HAD family phosphatase [Clostridia bacterium]